MSAKDVFHKAVKRALEKEGWRITHDPLQVKFEQVKVVIDLGAKELIGAERGGREIAVEIKSFLGSSALSQFHSALGQFMTYRFVLEQKEPERDLYLAVPMTTYEEFFQLRFGQLAIEHFGLKLIVYEAETEEIVQWVE